MLRPWVCSPQQANFCGRTVKTMVSKTSTRRGSVLSMAIVVSVVITAMVVALSWTAGVQSQITGSRSKSDEAYFVAEAGAQRFAWYVRNGSTATLTSSQNDTYTDSAGKSFPGIKNWGSITM